MIEQHSMKVKRGESFAQEEYREVNDSQMVAKKADDQNIAKIGKLKKEIEQLKSSKGNLEDAMKWLEDSKKIQLKSVSL